jgi:hypothetical protein
MTMLINKILHLNLKLEQNETIFNLSIHFISVLINNGIENEELFS